MIVGDHYWLFSSSRLRSWKEVHGDRLSSSLGVWIVSVTTLSLAYLGRVEDIFGEDIRTHPEQYWFVVRDSTWSTPGCF
jgi:hypothetical protein